MKAPGGNKGRRLARTSKSGDGLSRFARRSIGEGVRESSCGGPKLELLGTGAKPIGRSFWVYLLGGGSGGEGQASTSCRRGEGTYEKRRIVNIGLVLP